MLHPQQLLLSHSSCFRSCTSEREFCPVPARGPRTTTPPTPGLSVASPPPREGREPLRTAPTSCPWPSSPLRNTCRDFPGSAGLGRVTGKTGSQNRTGPNCQSLLPGCTHLPPIHLPGPLLTHLQAVFLNNSQISVYTADPSISPSPTQPKALTALREAWPGPLQPHLPELAPHPPHWPFLIPLSFYHRAFVHAIPSALLAHPFTPQHSAQGLPPQGNPPQPPSHGWSCLKSSHGTAYPPLASIDTAAF